MHASTDLHNRTLPRRRLVRAAALLVASTAVLGACSKSAPTAEPTTRPSDHGSPLKLAGVCPDPVVVQFDWAPEAEHGGLYQLVGDGYEIDRRANSVRAPLVASGRDTGVDIEIRAGGPAVDFEPVTSLMATDPDITLGTVTTDDAVGLPRTQRLVGVVTTLDIYPQIVMWDPRAHPEFQTISDIGQTDTTVLYAEGRKYMDYLVGSGILKRNQVDPSYEGDPSRFVAAQGRLAQQGYATDEPFLYENLLPQWNREVDFQLVHETGYPVYPSAVTVRADEMRDLAPCLRKVVPIVQQAQVDYVRDPQKVNNLLVSLAREYDIGWNYTARRAQFSVEQQLELGIVGNGENATLGDFDRARLQRVVEIVTTVLPGQGDDVQAGLGPADLATNRFIDESIGLPR